MRRIAIIPARGGSKRLSRKNILSFEGHPIIAYTIKAARKSRCFECVVVSTDDSEISEIAEANGAIVYQRSPELATDRAQVVDVCLDFIDSEEAKGCTYEVLCCLYATAVLRTADDIRATVELIEPGHCDFAMAVSLADRYAYQALRVSNSGSLVPMWPELVGRRSQEVGTLWFSNGTTYAVSVDAFRKEKSFYGPRLRGHFMPRERAIDIDTIEDVELARFYFSRSLAGR